MAEYAAMEVKPTRWQRTGEMRWARSQHSPFPGTLQIEWRCMETGESSWRVARAQNRLSISVTLGVSNASIKIILARLLGRLRLHQISVR